MEIDLSNLPTTLTSAQRVAILHQGSPLLIIAGPGSGKTEVIAWRVSFLVRAGLAKPDYILATTITNKALLVLMTFRVSTRLSSLYLTMQNAVTSNLTCQETAAHIQRKNGSEHRNAWRTGSSGTRRSTLIAPGDLGQERRCANQPASCLLALRTSASVGDKHDRMWSYKTPSG
jgi:superfamily I DNA/RNA helicase